MPTPQRCASSSSSSSSSSLSSSSLLTAAASAAGAEAPRRRAALIMHYQLADLQLPPALNYVAAACGWQAASVDCLLFVVVSDSDADEAKRRPASLFSCRAEDDALPANVQLRVLSHAEWATLLMRGAHVVAQPLGNHRKQADYKPLYPDIFSAFIPEHTYSHYGWFDPDTLLGNVSLFTENLSVDIYTAYWPPPNAAGESYVAGQLAIFRNTPAMRHLYMGIPALVERMNDPAQLGLDESILGEVVFAAADRFGYRVKKAYEAFQDYPNEPGFDGDDYYFERGRILAVRKCSADAAPREGVHIHVAGIKRSPRSESCDFLEEARGWALPRWNLAATAGPDRLVPSFASFHDADWGRRGC